MAVDLFGDLTKHLTLVFLPLSLVIGFAQVCLILDLTNCIGLLSLIISRILVAWHIFLPRKTSVLILISLVTFTILHFKLVTFGRTIIFRIINGWKINWFVRTPCRILFGVPNTLKLAILPIAIQLVHILDLQTLYILSCLIHFQLIIFRISHRFVLFS